MTELTDFIAQRKAELQARRDTLEAELGPIRMELSELQRVDAALAGQASFTRRRRNRRLTVEPSHGSIQGMCLRAVRDAPAGLTATEIQGWVSANLGRDVARTSLAPQLSRMCADGWLVNNEGRYSPGKASTTHGTGPGEDDRRG